ncbi:MAG: hypothetical protein ACJ75B_03295 [Flavisolibacter sp.]
MEHLLFVAYLVLFAWLVTKVKFFRNSGLTNPQLVILFLLKVLAGIFYGWIGIYYGQMAQMVDTWAYHVESIQQYHLLQTHPLDFFTDLFHTSYQGGYGNFLTTHDSWWNDVKANFLIKVMALFNLFSFAHYYVNVIFYSFITLFGPVAIYRVMQNVFPSRRYAVLVACFLLPSFLYWTSGLHKEGLIFLGLALMIYHFYFGFKENKFPIYRIFLIILGFLLVLILRNFLVLALIPPLCSWAIASKTRLKPAWVYLVTCAFFIFLFFSAKYINPALDFPQATVVKQQEFLKLVGGGSAIEVNPLVPSFKGFLINAPQALSMTVLRPYPSDVKHLLSLAAAVEIDFFLLLFLIFLVGKKKETRMNPFILFCLSLSFAILMMVGYTVDILGAIVRYRSIVLPFLIVPMVAQIDWTRMYRLVFSNINQENNI